MGLRVAIAALCLQQVHMYATKMTSTDCGLSLSAGETIMYNTAVSSTSRTVFFEDSTGTAVACGSEYTAGATYTAQLSSTSNEYVIEISGGTFDSGSCSAARVTSNGESLTAPTDGSDLVGWAGWSSGSSVAVKITDTCTLVAPTTTPAPVTPVIPDEPSALPTPTPTRIPEEPSALPVPVPTAVSFPAPTSAWVPVPTSAPTIKDVVSGADRRAGTTRGFASVAVAVLAAVASHALLAS